MNKNRSMRNYFAKAIIAVTSTLFSVLLTGCYFTVQDIKPPVRIAAENQHLVELAPKLSTHNLQPMFMVEALGFKAVDETGWDWWGFDEIYAVWQSNAVVSTLIQDDVDSGNSFDFHPL